MTAVERVACKDATVVFKLYMDFVLVICIWKRCFASANCLSFTLEMYLHPLFFFFVWICALEFSKETSQLPLWWKKNSCELEPVSAESPELVDGTRNELPVNAAKEAP